MAMNNIGIGAGIVGIVGALVVAPVLFGSWYTIDEGERGVILMNGKYVEVADPGLHFKWPIIESVEKISIRSYTQVYSGMTAYSKDQQPAQLQASVTFSVPADQVATVYSEYTNIDNLVARVLDRVVPNQMENVFGKYTAISVVQNREKFSHDVREAIMANLPPEVHVEGVNVENIDFSNAYEQSVEDRMKAEVEVATRNQNLEKEKINAQIVETTAQGEAAANLARAEAEAAAIRMRGEASAAAIRARADALRENAQLVELIKAERWNGVLPTTVLPNDTVPFIDAK
jgi:regulator of protease activity HflC (stomatin/prohibitin superfamily)